MKNTVLFSLILLILIGCAHRKVDEPTPSLPDSSKAYPAVTKSKSRAQSQAIFHVVEPLGVHLILLNMDKNTEETVYVDKTLTAAALVPGFWQVSGFILNGKRYKMMNTSKHFIFHLKKKEATYVGSYIFQCPKVNKSHMASMKKMSFFNRYPFSSVQRLCEMVVGHDFQNVDRVYREMEKRQQVPLSLGF